MSLFKQAVTVGKRTHAETDIGSNAVSVSYAAVELAKKIFGNLSSKHILILGAGKMGEPCCGKPARTGNQQGHCH